MITKKTFQDDCDDNMDAIVIFVDSQLWMGRYDFVVLILQAYYNQLINGEDKNLDECLTYLTVTNCVHDKMGGLDCNWRTKIIEKAKQIFPETADPRVLQGLEGN